MSEENPDFFSLDDNNSNENQWIQELRFAIERGCDLGSIRNIGECRALTDDLRLPVWKVRNQFEIDF